MTYRRVVLALLGIQTIGTILLCISAIITELSREVIVGTGIAAMLYSGLLAAYWRGWDTARYLAIIIATLATVIVLPEPYVTHEVSYTLFAAPVQALVLGNAAWVLGSALVVYGGMLVKAGGQGVYADPVTIVLFGLINGGMSLSYFLTASARRAAEASARIAEVSAQQAEQLARDSALQTRALREKSAELQQRNEEQQRLLDLVATLETPVIVLAQGILLATIVGHLDSRRAGGLTRRLLYAARNHRARVVIIDVAGVATIDIQVARSLIDTAQALRLLGCRVAMTGISAAIATTMTHLEIDLLDIETARSPQEILAKYMPVQATSVHGTHNGQATC